MNKNHKAILDTLPYKKPFLFVDELTAISENGVEGKYTFKRDAYFYEGHFIDNPITPGVLLTECMAQIGVVCLGIYLLKTAENEIANNKFGVALSNNTIDFYKPVYPDETVTVISEKIYFRFNKLKCKVRMLNEQKEVVAKGEISGMVIVK